MNCIGNTGKKDILYKGRRIGTGENYMLDKDGNYIDSITDNTKEINELKEKQIKEINELKEIKELKEKQIKEINELKEKQIKELAQIKNSVFFLYAKKNLVQKETKVEYSFDDTFKVDNNNFTLQMPDLIEFFNKNYKPDTIKFAGKDVIADYYTIDEIRVMYFVAKGSSLTPFEVAKYTPTNPPPVGESIISTHNIPAKSFIRYYISQYMKTPNIEQFDKFIKVN